MSGEIKQSRWTPFLGRLEQLAHDEGDSSDLAIQKTLVLTFALIMSFAGILWGAIYLIWDEPVAVFWPFAYSFFSGRQHRPATLPQTLRLVPRFSAVHADDPLHAHALPGRLCQLGRGGGLVLHRRSRPSWFRDGARRSWFLAFLACLLIAFLEGSLRADNNLPTTSSRPLRAQPHRRVGRGLRHRHLLHDARRGGQGRDLPSLCRSPGRPGRGRSRHPVRAKSAAWPT
ncbi:MAG: hypothetical protein R3A10_17520 [Caldilineaceae bacterium]